MGYKYEIIQSLREGIAAIRSMQAIEFWKNPLMEKWLFLTRYDGGVDWVPTDRREASFKIDSRFASRSRTLLNRLKGVSGD